MTTIEEDKIEMTIEEKLELLLNKSKSYYEKSIGIGIENHLIYKLLKYPFKNVAKN